MNIFTHVCTYKHIHKKKFSLFIFPSEGKSYMIDSLNTNIVVTVSDSHKSTLFIILLNDIFNFNKRFDSNILVNFCNNQK